MTDPTAVAGFDPDAFDAFEAAGWDARSDPYDAFWAPITVRAADAVLDAAGVHAGRRGTRLLDVGCGTGHVSARAASLGAVVTGLDVAPSMVAAASALVPEAAFVVGSAEALPFAAGAFDGVVANFVLLHVGRQEVALAEMARVLRPGGGLGVTLWDEGAADALHAVLLAAVAEVGVTPPADLPPGPPAFYPDEAFSGLVAAAGFSSVAVSHLAFSVAFPDAEAMWSGMLRAGVRFPPLVNAQPPEIRTAIRAAFERRLAPYAVDGGLEVPTSIQVTAARR